VDVDLPKLIERFGNEDKCHAYLEELRWPDGVKCPRCGSDKISRIAARRQFDCDGCRYQFSVRVDSVFHDSKLPLWKWFLAVYLMCESKKGMSAAQLGRTLGVTSKTAWFLCHRIRSAMQTQGELLSGVVEVDETYIGGKTRYHVPSGPHGHGGGDGSWRKRKTMVMGAIERGGEVRLRVVKGPATKRALQGFVRENVADDATAIYTDDAPAYGNMADADTAHETVNHSADEWVRGDVHTNSVESVWSLFDRAVVGSYHKLSVKHLPAYVQEFEFRFNNRRNPFLFRDTILALVAGDSLPYKRLIAAK
jgi:transposase-like protein